MCKWLKKLFDCPCLISSCFKNITELVVFITWIFWLQYTFKSVSVQGLVFNQMIPAQVAHKSQRFLLRLFLLGVDQMGFSGWYLLWKCGSDSNLLWVCVTRLEYNSVRGACINKIPPVSFVASAVTLAKLRAHTLHGEHLKPDCSCSIPF